MLRLLLLSTLAPASLLAQGTFIPPATLAASNAATRTSAIAPGSYVAIYFTPQNYLPLPNGVLTLTTSDKKVLPLTSVVSPTAIDPANPNELWVPIPANAVLGPATITLTTDQPRQTVTIQIVATAPGLFTAAYTAYGPALALNHPSTRNALTSAAIPGGTVSLFATGLGGARTSDVSVELAGESVAPLYAGPQGQPGLDQINFVVPQDALLGCYVPIVIRVRGIVSNQTSISVNKDPFACAHPLGLTYSDLKTLDAGGHITLAPLSIMNDNSPAQLTENATFTFPGSDALNVAMRAGVQMPETQLFSCTMGDALRSATEVAAGIASVGTLTITGPGGKRIDMLPDKGTYSSGTPRGPQPFFTAGPWQVSATGSPSLGAFQQDFTLPPPLQLVNLDSSTTIPSQGYTLRWDGAGFTWSDIVTVYLSGTTGSTYASCTAPAWAGQLTLPLLILQNFKGTTVAFAIDVHPRPGTQPLFSITNPSGAPIRGIVDYSFIQRLAARVE